MDNNNNRYYTNVLPVTTRGEFRNWLSLHSADESECWVKTKRGKPVDDEHFWYLDAVEEALCFGWIDSTQCKIDGVIMQRFSPRRKSSPWSELNKERVRRMERLGLMTDAGRRVLPPMGADSFQPDADVVSALKQADVWTTFMTFPELYRRIRIYNIMFYKHRNREQYEKGIKHLIECTQQGKMFGEWNDYGRLI